MEIKNSAVQKVEDYYYDEKGRMVLTEKFLKKRGFCCQNNCRHCPYKKEQIDEKSMK